MHSKCNLQKKTHRTIIFDYISETFELKTYEQLLNIFWNSTIRIILFLSNSDATSSISHTINANNHYSFFSPHHALFHIGCYDGLVYVLQSKDGEIHWTFATEDTVKSSAVVDPSSGLVYIGSHDQHVYALDIYVRTLTNFYM